MGGFRRGVGNSKAKIKLDVGKHKYYIVARLCVVSRCYPSRKTKDTASHRFSSSQQSKRLVVRAASLDIW